MIKKLVYAFLLSFLFTSASFVRAVTPLEEEKDKEKARTGLVVLPVIFSMPETKLGGGVGGLFTYRPAASAPAARPSSLYFAAIYTQLKQFEIELKPEWYLRQDRYFISGDFIANKFPNKYWGIGNDVPEAGEENYTPRTLRVDLSFQRKIFLVQKVYLGVLYRFEHIKMLKSDEGKTIASGKAPGSPGGTTSGIGFIIDWDSRDNVFYPRTGNYFQIKFIFHEDFLGSNYDFNLLDVDLRKYVSVFPRGVLALQTVVQTYGGTAPFYKMPMLGGDATMRGYYKGRYRDRSLLALQAELRFPLWKRFSAVLFSGFGQVAPGLGRQRLDGFKYSIGLGLRFLVVPKEGANLRLDLAFGQGSSGFYFNANEAF